MTVDNLAQSDREQIAALVARLREQHELYEDTSHSWTAEASERRKELRTARAQTLSDIQSALAGLGEGAQVEELERLPFERKLLLLESLLVPARPPPAEEVPAAADAPHSEVVAVDPSPPEPLAGDQPAEPVALQPPPVEPEAPAPSPLEPSPVDPLLAEPMTAERSAVDSERIGTAILPSLVRAREPEREQTVRTSLSRDTQGETAPHIGPRKTIPAAALCGVGVVAIALAFAAVHVTRGPRAVASPTDGPPLTLPSAAASASTSASSLQTAPTPTSSVPALRRPRRP